MPSGSRILEVGCGSGAWGSRIAGMGYKVIGMDISRKMVEAAHDLAKNMEVDFSPICGDAENLPFKSENFDCVIFSFCLHHISDITSAFKETSRCLKHNGKIILPDINGSNPVRRIGSMLGKMLNRIVGHNKYSSPTERSFPVKNIYRELQRNKFKNVETSWLFALPGSEAKPATFLSLKGMYVLSFKIAHKLLPKHMGAAEFIMLAEKDG